MTSPSSDNSSGSLWFTFLVIAALTWFFNRYFLQSTATAPRSNRPPPTAAQIEQIQQILPNASRNMIEQEWQRVASTDLLIDRLLQRISRGEGSSSSTTPSRPSNSTQNEHSAASTGKGTTGTIKFRFYDPAIVDQPDAALPEPAKQWFDDEQQREQHFQQRLEWMLLDGRRKYKERIRRQKGKSKAL